MITRILTICTFVILSVLLIFCFTSLPDNAELAQGSRVAAAQDEAGARDAVNGASAAESAMPAESAAAAQPRAMRQFRNLPSMNIPAGFFLFAVPIMVLVLISIIGIIVNDISREDEEAVEDIFGTLN